MIWSRLGLEGVGLGVGETTEGETHGLGVAMDSYFWQYLKWSEIIKTYVQQFRFV